MASAGTLNINVVANVDQATSGLNKVSQNVGDFEKSLTKVDMSSRTLKKSMGELGTAFGSLGSAGANIAMTMIKMGPAVGLAVAALHILNKVNEDAARTSKYLADSMDNTAKISQKFGEMLGTIQPAGFFSVETNALVAEMGEQIKKDHEELEALTKSWIPNEAAIRAVNKQLNNHLDLQAQMLKLGRQQDTMSGERETYKQKDFELKMGTKKGSYEEILGNIDNQREYVEKLRAELEKLPEGGTAYLKVLHEWQDMMLKLHESEDALLSKNEKLHEQQAKKEQEFIDHLEEEAKKADKLSEEFFKKQMDRVNKFAEENKTPLEHLKDKLEDISDLFEQGGINSEMMDRGMKRAIEEFDKATAKDAPKDRKVGAFKQIDLSQISVQGLQIGRDQKVKDPQLEITNDLLRDIKSNILGIGAEAMTS